jgi:hypothetical protein
MSRLLLSATVTAATVHSALVQATRPELSLTIEQDPKRGLVGRLDMKNTAHVPLAFEDGRYSARKSSNERVHVSNLEGIGYLRHRVFFTYQQKWCFEVIEEFFWDQMKTKQLRMELDPGEKCKLAVVQFARAETPDEVSRFARREAGVMDAQFHVTCRPFPRLVPSYTIEHSFKLSEEMI